MAIIDTGLGWEADENWLKRYDGQLGTVSGVEKPDYFSWQPLNVRSDMTSSNYSDLTKQYGNTIAENEIGYSNGKVYALADTSGCYVAREGTMNAAWDVFSTKSTAHVALVFVRGNSVTHQSRLTTSLTAVYPPLYMQTLVRNQNYNTYNIPTSKTYSQYAADFTSIAQTTYKLEDDGYAVACMIKWYDADYLIHNSSVLISTAPSYTEQSIDGTTSAGAPTSAHWYRGKTFTMSIVDLAGPYTITSQVEYRDLLQFGAFADIGELFRQIARMASITVTVSDNPYGPDPSTEQGGNGTGQTDDEVGLEPVVFPGAVGTGFCRIYCPSASELSALSDYLWGPLFDLDTVKRLFADPMSSVLGLSVVPVIVSGTSSPVSIAGVSTGISLPKLSVQHINVDLGSLQVTENWGAYLDYEPYTKYSIYLPFIGYRTISADDVMGKWVNLSYDIDLLSGACVAKLVAGGALLYQWAGNCAMQLPVNAANWNSVISSSIAAIGSMATAIASGGAAAPVVTGALSSAATLATQMKPNIERAGGVNGAAAFLAGRRAYMIRTMPELVNPGNQQHYIGYPSFITKQLGSITGFNVVEDIHLEGIPATQAELEEIDTLLHGGVIL